MSMMDFARQQDDGTQALLNLLDEGVVLHAGDGSIIACSAAAERILGISSARLAGSPSLFPGLHVVLEDGSPLLPDDEPVRVALRSQQTCRDVTVRLRRPNGETAWLVLSAAPLPHHAADKPGALTVFDEITERKSLEHRLRGTHRMEAIGRLAGGVAHDFNNLLTAILGYNAFLLRSLDASDPRRHEAEEVRNAANRAAELTRQLLAFSRREVVEPQVLDTNAVIADMHAMLRRLIGEDVHLDVHADPAVGRVRVDRTQLEQILLNLAINARDAMPLGGELRVATRNAVLDQAFADAHPGSRSGHYVLLTVEDNGSGMDAETLAHIFEPFFTTKPHDKGTGLGLATVYGIVKQNDGYIDVDSIPGQGTTFRIYLPRCDEAPLVSPPSPLRAAPPRATGTVLLVEDDEQVRRLARRILEEQGYTVLEEADGLKALTVLDRHPGTIDVLVTDVVMPGLGGPELARRAAERRPGLRVLHLSGYTDAALVHQGAQSGLHFLSKPFDAESLTEKLRDALAISTEG